MIFMILLIFSIFCFIRPRLLNSFEVPSENISSKSFWGPPGAGHGHLHVYVHLSDLHLSAFVDPHRITDLSEFCQRTLDLIKPEVAIITGDLTDAKLENNEGSTQNLFEWREYARVLKNANITNKTVWLDIRGNHDNFDIADINSPINYYRNYSVRGKHGQLSYHYKHVTEDGDQVSFVAVDACLDPGPKRPFNFFGTIADKEAKKIKSYIKETSSSMATIFFGHYTTSVISYPGPAFARDLLRSGYAYLCGHLHTFANLLNQMHVHQKEGFLELELGDWKDLRIYRVLALDHGFLSFTDVYLHHFPVAMVTNPKHEKYMIHQKEPLENMIKSSHIRILAFSDVALKVVNVSIDGQHKGQAKHVSNLLHVLPWNPKEFKRGYHQIDLYVEDIEGKSIIVTHPFSLDGSKTAFSLFQRFVLSVDHTFFFKVFFAFCYVFTIFPLIFFKIFNTQLLIDSNLSSVNWVVRYCQKWIRRFSSFCNHNPIYVFTLFYHLYIVVGPWFVGYVLSDHIGACFLFGVVVKGTLLPTSLTYLYGACQLLIFNIPLNIYLAKAVDRNIAKKAISSHVSSPVSLHSSEVSKQSKFFQKVRNKKHVQRWVLKPGKYFSENFVFFFIIFLQAYLVLSGFLKAYGLVAFLLNPLRTWAIFLAIFLHGLILRDAKKHKLSLARTNHANEVTMERLLSSINDFEVIPEIDDQSDIAKEEDDDDEDKKKKKLFMEKEKSGYDLKKRGKIFKIESNELAS